jgi:hypothetical protein
LGGGVLASLRADTAQNGFFAVINSAEADDNEADVVVALGLLDDGMEGKNADVREVEFGLSDEGIEGGKGEGDVGLELIEGHVSSTLGACYLLGNGRTRDGENIPWNP